uniref:Uncharacterized protein n=1 Tax=Rhodopseudomonas palustris (strain BisA53) TaxID=316055 RepID=Q07NU5_RHOP5
MTWITRVLSDSPKITIMWQPVETVPEGIDIALAVIDHVGVHSLVFPCRHSGDRWISSITQRTVDVHPTHWQLWTSSRLLQESHPSDGEFLMTR